MKLVARVLDTRSQRTVPQQPRTRWEEDSEDEAGGEEIEQEEMEEQREDNLDADDSDDAEYPHGVFVLRLASRQQFSVSASRDEGAGHRAFLAL
jgi:hypothetical protein